MPMNPQSVVAIALVAIAQCSCGVNVSPSADADADARAQGDSSDAGMLRDVAEPDSSSDGASDVVSDTSRDGGSSSDVVVDSAPPDSAVPPFYSVLETYAIDDDPSRDNNIANRPFWYVFAALFSNVLQRTRLAVPGGSCESVAYTELPRLDLGAGEAVLGARVEPMAPRQPNWFRTQAFSELLPVGQEVLVRFSGAGPIGAFTVSSTLPPPTTVLAPRVPMGQPALIASVASPLAVRFAPTNDRVRVRLSGEANIPGARRRTSCDFDGRTGEVAVPPEMLRLHWNASPATGDLLVFVSIDTVRTARVTVAGYDTEFEMRSISANFGLWLTP